MKYCDACRCGGGRRWGRLLAGGLALALFLGAARAAAGRVLGLVGRLEVQRLLEHVFLQQLLRHLVRVVALVVEVEDAGALGLRRLAVQLRQVLVRQRLHDRDALVRVEHQHLAQQVQRQRVDAGEDGAKVLLGVLGHALDGGLGELAHALQVVVGGRAQQPYDEVELRGAGGTLEERAAREDLGKDAAGAPNVHGRAVGGTLAQQLRRAVPARDDVLGQLALRLGGDAAREAEVADGQVAVAVDQQVGRLEVAVQHAGAVHVLEAAQDLVEEVLRVAVGETLAAADDAVQVALVELRDDVEVLEVLRLGRPRLQVHNLHDVVMRAQVPQQLDLAQDALGVDEVLEDLAHALDGHLAPCLCVLRTAHQAVGALADGLEVHIARAHLELVAPELELVVLVFELATRVRDGHWLNHGGGASARDTSNGALPA
mmetsp:Transcript_105847/g.294711  ORF Transcript_105847/g.294711 Transcript_105847/m.294711 type:complete len:430 (+) Transcript_105847:189-1478(+)